MDGGDQRETEGRQKGDIKETKKRQKVDRRETEGRQKAHPKLATAGEIVGFMRWKSTGEKRRASKSATNSHVPALRSRGVCTGVPRS